MIREEVKRNLGEGARVRLFGSRVDDSLRGGDIDLLVECDDRINDPALLAARISARISRAMGGRKVDVVLHAPNLQKSSIHAIAKEYGVLL